MIFEPGEDALEVRNIGPARITAGLETQTRLGMVEHRAVHGTPPQLPPDDLMALAGVADLRGRGGAGFPFARKYAAVLRSAHRKQSPVRVVVNATEGEPAARKDEMLLTRTPHLVLDGAELAAWSLNAPEVIVGVADGPGERSLLEAIDERDSDLAFHVVRVPERFISGEGGALVRAINGQVPIPPGRKVRAAESGVGGVPTLLSNAETYAQLGLVAMLGADLYTAVGIPTEPGTVLLTVSVPGNGDPTIVETPTGVLLRDVLELCGTTPGRGVLIGGYHGAWLSADAADSVRVSRAGMKAAGAALGAGIIAPLSEDACPLEETARVLHYMAGESANQCGPCFRGLPELARTFSELAAGEGEPEAVVKAALIGEGRGACSHPDGTARFARSALAAFPDEIAIHAAAGSCNPRTKKVLPLSTVTTGASKMMLDWSRCDGHGLCSVLAPDLVQLDNNGYPQKTVMAVPEKFRDTAEKAVEMCPALALRIDDATAH
ncbi:NADH-ubiquinone oxidoreductase-F iron-sulfur binding region domain-containing protein [Nocardiopsis sediminis]|uniref:NADH-ubiquinone oxidoreductase-F iron-sulfur binding region domain-containing protein n=1 Tax=Nocardiopsis sediminis TaxID=1778267 RepID=A0ABV8FJC5_9ACTN